MSVLEQLRAADSLEAFAHLLGFSPRGLAYVLYKISEERKYSTFEIPKKTGGMRIIKAPDKRLALLQRRLANLLYACLEELKNSRPIRYRSLAHGFEKKRSIVTNAALHKRRRYVLNFDLEDFFPSINFGRVYGFFIKDKNFQTSAKVATLIAQIACHENSLPQGSPCSPVIANLITHILDARLARIAKKFKCTYSRYADDITFSTGQKIFPAAISFPVPPENQEWMLGERILKAVTSSGFLVNNKKTRMQFRTSRQLTTGLMVNDKVNIRQEYWLAARQMCRSLFEEGVYYKWRVVGPESGEASSRREKIEYVTLSHIRGVMAHIYHVKNSSDKRSDAEKKEYPTSFVKLYRKFLFFKNFVMLDRPFIITEGKTDPVYLRCAIRRLGEYHEVLGGVADGDFGGKVAFLNHASSESKVLELEGGTGQLNAFVAVYNKNAISFPYKEFRFPVIVLIDNDDGGKSLFKMMKSRAKIDVSYSSTEDFYYMGYNLYVIKTPEGVGETPESCIEDLFPEEVLNMTLGGKSFNKSNDHDGVATYGKALFAKNIVEKNYQNINFDKFKPLLDRIVSVLRDYEKLIASGTHLEGR